MKDRKPVIAHLMAIFTIVVWGITFISIKVLLTNFSPVEIIFYRLVLAVLALTIVSPPPLPNKKLDRTWFRSEWKFMAAGLCGVTFYSIFQNIALVYTQAANVSVLLSAAPLLTALACRIFLREKLKTNFFLGFAIAIAGVTLISFNGVSIQKVNPLGDLLTMMAALSWAFYGVLIKQIGAESDDVIAVTRKVLTYGLLFLLPMLPFFEFETGLGRLAVLPNLLNLAFLGVGASAACFVTWNGAVRLLGPVKTSAYIYLIPVITSAASIFLLDEVITWMMVAGMALILVGMVLSEYERAVPA